MFGPTRLPEDQLRVLRALAVHRDVHLWLPHPSPALWDRRRRGR
ncbi:exodeoxyribonuclease V subunit gamma [Georgenia sp. SUBG003]